MDSFISPLRSLNIFIIAILNYMLCTSALLHFSSLTGVGLMCSSGDSLSLLLLIIIDYVFILTSKHLNLGDCNSRC